MRLSHDLQKHAPRTQRELGLAAQPSRLEDLLVRIT